MRKYSLYTIVFAVFVVLIVVSSVSLYFIIKQHRQDLIETAIKEKIHLAETINETLASPVWIYRLALVPGIERSFISEIADFKDVRYVRMVNSDGTIYKSSIEGEWGKIIKDPDISRVMSSRRVVVKDQTFKGEKVKLIIYPGYEGKTIWVAFTLKGIEQVIRKMWIRDVAVIIMLLLSFLLVLFIILQKVMNPIREITSACQEIRRGNLNVKIRVSSRTEIGELADTFNKTIADLKESKDALEKSKASLEMKVRARTKELQDLTESLEKKVRERTREVYERMKELEKFQKVTVGREIKMIELKREIKRLKEELKKNKGRSK